MDEEIDRLLRRREVEQIVGFSRAWIYSRMAKGEFPKPVHIGASVRWRESDVRAWIREKDKAA